MADSAELSIEALHVTKKFGSLIAVNDLSLSIQPGICFGLLGPNGAGKTTFIEILEGIIAPTQGEVRYRGRPRRDSFKEHIGIMFQNTALLSYMTVSETLAAFRSLYRKPADLEQVIELCQLNDIRHRFNDRISGGQRQRLLLALSLINQPDLLFLDEPSTGLDPQARRNLWDIISTVKEQGKTIILTTHYMEEAQHMCDQVAIIDQGKLVVQGPPARLVADFSQGALIHLDMAALDKISGTIPFKITRQNHRQSIHVSNMNHDLGLLLELGVDLSRMDVEMPNLETVFLNLTGRSLRE